MNNQQLIKELYLSNKQLRELVRHNNTLLEGKFTQLNDRVDNLQTDIDYIKQQNQIIINTLILLKPKEPKSIPIDTCDLDETDRKLEALLQFNTTSSSIIGSPNVGIISEVDNINNINSFNGIGTSIEDFITLEDINDDIELDNSS